MGLGTKIILIIILLHLIVGFGFIIKLTLPKKENRDKENQ